MTPRAAAVAAVLAAIAFALPFRAAEPAGPDRVRQEKARLEEVRRKAETAAAELAATIGREKVSREKMAELKGRLAQQNRIVAGINRKLVKLGAQQDVLSAEARDLAGRRARTARDLSSMARSLFLMERDRTALPGPPGRGERARYFARKAAAARLAEYGRLVTDEEAVEEKLDGIERTVEASARRKVKEAEVGAALASKTEAESRKLEELGRQKKRKEKELKAFRARIAAMEALVRKIERQTRARERRAGTPARREVPRFAGIPGGLRPPLDGRIVARFGTHHDPVFDVDLENRGIEIEAPSGSAVRAIGKGEVVFNGTVAGFGKVLIIQHGSGLFSVYGKAESFSAAQGRKVAAGEAVGRLPDGPDGKSVLYLELRAAGNAIDPLSAIPFAR